MKRALSVIALFLLAPLLPAADIKGPDKVDVYKLVKLTVAVPDKGAVQWSVYPRGVADTDKTVRGQLIFTGPPGTYEVTAAVITIKDGAIDFEESTKYVVIGTPVPPKPPDPPTPVPDDALSRSLAAAYAHDTEPGHAANLLFLRDVYRGLAPTAAQQPLKTNADAQAWVHSKIAAPTVGLTDSQLVNTRKAIAAEATATFGTNPTTPYDGAKFGAFLQRVADALGKVAP